MLKNLNEKNLIMGSKHKQLITVYSEVLKSNKFKN